MDLNVNVGDASIRYECRERIPRDEALFDVEVHLPGLREVQRLDRAVIQRENRAFTPDAPPSWLHDDFDKAWKIAVITERSLEQNPIPGGGDPYPYYFRLNGYWVALRQLRRLIQDRIRKHGIPEDSVNINMTCNGNVLDYSTDLPIPSSLYDLGKKTVQYIVGNPVHDASTEIRSALFVLSLHREDKQGYGDWRPQCERLANALGLDRTVLSIDDILRGGNIDERYELLCCCGPDLQPHTRGNFFDALIELVKKTNPRIVLLLMPKTACAVNYRDGARPLGYAQLLVEGGVPHCFALSRYVPVQGRQCLLDRLAKLRVESRPIIHTNLVTCISNVIINSTNEYHPGGVYRVFGGGFETTEHTEIAAMSTVLVSSNRIDGR